MHHFMLGLEPVDDLVPGFGFGRNGGEHMLIFDGVVGVDDLAILAAHGAKAAVVFQNGQGLGFGLCGFWGDCAFGCAGDDFL